MEVIKVIEYCTLFTSYPQLKFFVNRLSTGKPVTSKYFFDQSPTNHHACVLVKLSGEKIHGL